MFLITKSLCQLLSQQSVHYPSSMLLILTKQYPSQRLLFYVLVLFFQIEQFFLHKGNYKHVYNQLIFSLSSSQFSSTNTHANIAAIIPPPIMTNNSKLILPKENQHNQNLLYYPLTRRIVIVDNRKYAETLSRACSSS